MINEIIVIFLLIACICIQDRDNPPERMSRAEYIKTYKEHCHCRNEAIGDTCQHHDGAGLS